MKIRHSKEADLKAIVDVHNQAFENFFMTSLGSQFLIKYYRNYQNTNHLSLVIEDENHNVLGFVVGTNNSSDFYKSLKQDWRSFLFPLLKNVFNVRMLTKIFHRAHSLVLTNKVNTVIPPQGYNELTSIGVIPNSNIKGLGSRLLKEYESICKASGISGVYLTTDAVANESVLKFYQKHGFTIAQEFTQDNLRLMYMLIKSLD